MFWKSARYMAIAAAVCTSHALAAPAAAAPTEIRIGLQNGLPYLPFIVMEHEKLIDKYAKQAGIDEVKVTWFRAAGGNILNDGLLSGNLDVAATSIVSFLNLWSRSRSVAPLIAISAYSSSTLLLVTRNPKVKTVADLTEKDRVAVPAVKSSLQAIIFQMAVAQQFGWENRAKLDPITISRAHPDAMASLLSGTEINTHFSAPPYQDQELKYPNVHVVLSAKDVFGGPVCNGLFYTTERYYKQNPKIVGALNAALGEAEKIINHDARAAAQMYLDITKEKASVDEIEMNIKEPGSSYEQAPHGVMKIAEFMHRAGDIKIAPMSLNDILIPESHGLNGD